MKSPLQMVPAIVPAWVAGGRVNPKLMRPRVLANTSPNADEEWRFGRAEFSLTGLKAKGVLTPNPANLSGLLVPPGPTGADAYPVYSDAYLTTANRQHCGLILPFAQLPVETVWFVWSFNMTSNRRVFGNLTPTVADGGWDMSATSSLSPRITTRGITAVQAPAIPTGMTTGTWLFVGVSHTTTTRNVYFGNVGMFTDTGAPVVGARNHALGEVYYSGNWYGPDSFALLGHSPLAYGKTGFDDAYARAKAACAARGIALY